MLQSKKVKILSEFEEKKKKKPLYLNMTDVLALSTNKA